MSLNRKVRRAAEHAARKAARKAGFPTAIPTMNVRVNQPDLHIADGILENPGRPLPTLAEISPARLAANRINAQKSTGPTGDGRAISSQNRLTHGLARHNGVFKLLKCEDANGFEALKQFLAEEHEPSTETEAILVNAMAEAHWLAQRAQRLQDACFDSDSGQVTDPKLFSLYLRYQTTHTRAFHKSLNDLSKLRAERRTAEQHEMKKQHHYWDVLRKDSQVSFQISQNTREFLKGLREEPGFKAQFEADLARHGLKQGELTIAVR